MQFRGHHTKPLTLPGWPRLHGQADTPTLRPGARSPEFFYTEKFFA